MSEATLLFSLSPYISAISNCNFLNRRVRGLIYEFLIHLIHFLNKDTQNCVLNFGLCKCAENIANIESHLFAICVCAGLASTLCCHMRRRRQDSESNLNKFLIICMLFGDLLGGGEGGGYFNRTSIKFNKQSCHNKGL